MPNAYQHLRVRLRIEQTRLLNWGEKVGLVEELLEEPSRLLQQHRNLIIDILLEIWALFKSCVAIESKYDQLVPQKPVTEQKVTLLEDAFERRFPRGAQTMLSKTLNFLEKTSEMPKRLQWAIVKRERFEKLVTKLIDYNTSIEAILDHTAIDHLQRLQQQTYMAMLQLNGNVQELKEISLAIQINTTKTSNEVENFSHDKKSKYQQGLQDREFARLADFKAHQVQLDTQPQTAELDPIHPTDLEIDSSSLVRPSAVYQDKHFWIEWKYYPTDQNPESKWDRMIEDRIKKLAILLGSTDKPSEFNAPNCLGYFEDPTEKRYGFLYEVPLNHSPTPVSLLDLILSTTSNKRVPSLTKRVDLAHAIARSLLYLHSVDWLHKGLRSDNVIFFLPHHRKDSETQPQPDYAGPLIAGFEYARPDLPNEETEQPPEHSENDIYRHPSIIRRTAIRSHKSHDIYSLGIVLVEIAYWKRIDEIMEIPNEVKAAKARVMKVRELLLGGDYLEFIQGAVGEIYAEVTRRCLAGGEEIGIADHGYDDRGGGEAKIKLQEVFAQEVVGKLAGISI